MKTNFSFAKTVGMLALTLGVGGIAIIACSDSTNPTPPDVPDGSTGIIVIDAEPNKLDTSVIVANPDASPGGDASVDAVAAGGFTGPNGCWQGAPPVGNDQVLNACTDGTCTPFNNAARLPLYNNGNLPQVP